MSKFLAQFQNLAALTGVMAIAGLTAAVIPSLNAETALKDSTKSSVTIEKGAFVAVCAAPEKAENPNVATCSSDANTSASPLSASMGKQGDSSF